MKSEEKSHGESASSPLEKLWSTAHEIAMSFQASEHTGWQRRGVSRKGERIFNAGSGILLVVFAIGWSWSVANARAGEGLPPGVNPTAARLAASLTDGDAPSLAYLTDAMLESAVPKGESGKLRARIAAPGSAVSADTLPTGAVATFSSGSAAESTHVFRAPQRTGVWKLAINMGNAVRSVSDFSIITQKPASEKRAGKIGLYFIGNWPNRGKTPKADYTPPSGFIEVTPENQNTQLSEHFRMRDFLPHDQANVWPKYLVISLKLIDKLELVLDDLQKRGIDPRGVRVMSGFRTPQYNATGGETAGRAGLSRHMYGDASDIFIDNDGNGAMDDLNKDGRVDIGDARFILAAVNRVEAAHPSLIGGCGVYVATSAHGPFTHIDTRGYPARW